MAESMTMCPVLTTLESSSHRYDIENKLNKFKLAYGTICTTIKYKTNKKIRLKFYMAMAVTVEVVLLNTVLKYYQNCKRLLTCSHVR